MKFYNPSTFLKVLGKAPPLVVPTLLRCICHVMIRHRFCALQAWCRSHFNQRGNDNKELKDGIYGCCSLRRSSVSVYMHGYLTIHVHYGSWDNNNFLSETGPHAFGARVGERTFLQRPIVKGISNWELLVSFFSSFGLLVWWLYVGVWPYDRENMESFHLQGICFSVSHVLSFSQDWLLKMHTIMCLLKIYLYSNFFWVWLSHNALQ